MSDDLEDRVAALEGHSLTSGDIEMAALRQLVWGLADGGFEDYENLVEGVHSTLDNIKSVSERSTTSRPRTRRFAPVSTSSETSVSTRRARNRR